MKSPLHILHLEDDPGDARLVQSALKTGGIACTSARVETRDAFVAALEQGGIDLILSDFTLPTFDGLSAVEIVRAQWPAIPLILVSGTLGEERAIHSLKSGATDFILKESLNRLVPAVRRAMQEVEALAEQRRMEAALREGEAKFRTLFDKAHDGIFLLRNGLFVDCNAKGLELFGVTREQLIGQSPSSFSPPTQLDGRNSQEKAKGIIQSALVGEPQFFEWMHHRPDGTLFYSDISLSRFELHGEPYLQAIVRDITERKRTEARFRRLVDSNVQGVIFWNSKGEITGANETFLNLVGYTREDLEAGRINWRAMTPPEYAAFDQRALDEIALSGVCMPYEKAFIRKDGSHVPAIIGAAAFEDNPEEGVCFVLDLSERKRAEEQIAEQAALLDEAQDAILLRDLEGKILFWNKGAERMYGWTRQEVINRGKAELLHVDLKIFKEVNDLTISKGEWRGDLQHITKDQRKLTVAARWTLIRDNEGEPKSVFEINTDITEKKQIEAQFMRAQRMESIGTLAGGIAHDLNNILSPIMMSIELLRGSATDPEAKKILETIDVSSRRGADIVRQVLSFARGVEGERVEIQIKHVMRDLGSIIKDTFPKDIQLRFSVSNDIWTILGDPTQMHQILLNLCVNARDAMPNGGNLIINVENCMIDEQYAAMNVRAKVGRYVNISVTDSGTGMPQGIIDKIFEPFFTTKELNKGTGLGLSTVMGIVKGHDGFINVYSEPGKGTTFKVYLPAMESSSTTKKEVLEEVGLPRGNGETVLLVDDEDAILTITSQTLRAFGYQVLTAKNGANAVAIYAERKNEIAVVLTDMMMPVMDGTAVIRVLKQINPALKIIAASGLNANGSVIKASEDGVKHFLMKPYTAETLLKVLRVILDKG